MSGDWGALLPEMVIAVGGLGLLVFPWIKSPRLLGFITLSFLAAAFDIKMVAVLRQQRISESLFNGMLLQDQFSAFFQLIILVSMGLVVLSLMGYSREEARARRELYALLLLVTVGLLILVGAQNFALIYVGLETVSLLSYLLTGFLKKDSLAVEGALKYFLFGSLATGAFLYGISLIYGLTGTMDLALLGGLFPKVMMENPALGTLSILLLVVGLGFKVALVPFHMWAPDAYEGAATPVTAFLSVGPKLAGFAVLSRVFLEGFSAAVGVWPVLLGWLAVLTMTLGNVVALVQTNVKRMLAYSSTAHAGTMAIGLAVATPLGLTATLYYLVAYLLMNIGAFVGVIAVGNAAGREDIGAFAGLSRREPFLALMITISFLSLAGIPPMAGFFAKMWIFGAAVKARAFPLAVAAAANSVIAFFYYVKVVKSMYLDPAPAGAPRLPRSRALWLGLVVCTVSLFIVGLMPGPWLTFAADAIPFVLKTKSLPWM